MGIAGVSLRDVADTVGMRAPSLYTYFDSKAAIYDAMFVEGYEQMDQAAALIDVDPTDPVGSLTRLATEFLRFCQESIPRYQLMFTRAVPGWEPSPEAYAASVTSYQRTSDLLARLGIETQEDLDLATAFLAGLASQQVANDPHGDRWIRLAPSAVEMYLAHIGRSA